MRVLRVFENRRLQNARKPAGEETGLALIEVLLGLVVITIAIVGLERILSDRNATRIQAAEAREVRALLDNILARAKVDGAVWAMAEGGVSDRKGGAALKGEGLLAPVFGNTVRLAGAERAYGAYIKRGAGDEVSVVLLVDFPNVPGQGSAERLAFERLSGLHMREVPSEGGTYFVETGAHRVDLPTGDYTDHVAFVVSGSAAPAWEGNNNIVNFNLDPLPEGIAGSFDIAEADRPGFLHPLGTPLTYDIADKLRNGWRLEAVAEAPEVSEVPLPACGEGEKSVAMLAPNLERTFRDDVHEERTQTLNPFAFTDKTMDLYQPKPLFPDVYLDLSKYEGSDEDTDPDHTALTFRSGGEGPSWGVHIIPDETVKRQPALMRFASGKKLAADAEEQARLMETLGRALRTETETPGRYGSDYREWSQIFPSNYALGVAPARVNAATNRFTHTTFANTLFGKMRIDNRFDTVYARDNHVRNDGSGRKSGFREADIKLTGHRLVTPTRREESDSKIYTMRQSLLRPLLSQYGVPAPGLEAFLPGRGARALYDDLQQALQGEVRMKAFDSIGVEVYQDAVRNEENEAAVAAARATLEVINPNMAFYLDPARNLFRDTEDGFQPHEGDIFGGIVPVAPVAGYDAEADEDTVSLPTPAKSFPVGFNLDNHKLIMRCNHEGANCSEKGIYPAIAEDNDNPRPGRRFSHGRVEIYYPAEYREGDETKTPYRQFSFCYGES